MKNRWCIPPRVGRWLSLPLGAIASEVAGVRSFAPSAHSPRRTGGHSGTAVAASLARGREANVRNKSIERPPRGRSINIVLNGKDYDATFTVDGATVVVHSAT